MTETEAKRIKLGSGEEEHLTIRDAIRSADRQVALGSEHRQGEFADILSALFEPMRMQQLRICRLVSKQWNEAACEVMRKQSVTYLSNCKAGNLYQNFLFEILEKRNPRFPLPFKHFYIHWNNPNKMDVETVDAILRRCDAIMTKLKVGGNARRNIDFRIYGRSLTQLIFLDQVNDFLCPADKTDFPVLEYLTLDVKNVRESSVRNLMRNAPKIKGVVFTSSGQPTFINKEFLLEFVSLPSFEKIQSFTIHLDMSRITLADLDVRNVPQNLRSVVLQRRRQLLNPDLSRSHLAFLRKCSETIQHLDLGGIEINRDVAAVEFPRCPNLKYLQMYKLNGLYKSLGPLRFPSLKKIGFQMLEVSELENCESHEGVDFVKIFVPSPMRTSSTMKILLLHKLFPNCRHLDASNTFVEIYCRTTCRRESTAIIGWNLQTLTIARNLGFSTTSRYLFEALTGLSRETFEYATVLGLDPLSFVRQPSILDLKCLKTLILDIVGLDITESMIQFGLSRMELELLQFKWNENLSVNHVVKFLRPVVKKIVLSNCCEPRFAKQMELLFTQMSSVHCGCRVRNVDRLGFKSYTASKTERVQGLLQLSLS